MAQRGHGHRACVRMILAALSLLSVTEAAWSGADGGIAAYEHGDYATAYREFLPRAQRGDAQAQLFLGLMSMTGQGVPQDQAKAVMWLRKAAEQGDDTAQNALSNLLYTMGLRDPQYLPEARSGTRSWLSRALSFTNTSSARCTSGGAASRRTTC